VSAARRGGGALARQAWSRAGFSLVEALIALSLSGILVTLVSTVFVAQNAFYRDISRRSNLQENLRGTAELVAADVRALTESSILVAEGARLVARMPLVIGIVCGGTSSTRHVYLPLDGAPVTQGVKSGVGVLSTAGQWLHFEHAWSSLYGGSGEAATVSACASIGADTTGAASDFVRLQVPSEAADHMAPRATAMLFANTELAFGTSSLDPERRGLFRGIYGSGLTEFATGFSTGSRFEYRVDDAYLPAVSGSDLVRIDAVRIVVEASGDGAEEFFGWTVDVPLRNVALDGGGS
jgi:prepilin-type N-terminal cleavage/methylation domain-containing protein